MHPARTTGGTAWFAKSYRSMKRNATAAAIAEYYLTAADRDAAGRVLSALHRRRLREGGYRDAHSDASGQVSASLFNGICGIGYEMLRYARPRDVLSVL